MEEVIDPYKHKQRYENWLKNRSIKGVSKTNEKIVLKFIEDMSLGLNVSRGSKKGARTPIRLNTLRQRLAFVIKELEKRKIKDIKKVNAKQLHSLFEDMRSGKLPNRFGQPYKSTRDYVKIFKTFWHWYQRISKEKIEDITIDLDTRGEKPKFIFFTEKDFDNILKTAKADLKPILALEFDTGMRVTELVNVKVSDFSNNFKELNIREETSKTFGRKIKLMLCSEQVKKYIEFMELTPQDFFCKITPPMINKELRAIGKKVLTSEQIKYKNLTLYDFRHSSACFWLPKYKSESALKYRFGWKKSDMIHYYTELMGMKDTITQDDLYTDISKTELEKENIKIKEKIKILETEINQKVNSKFDELERKFIFNIQNKFKDKLKAKIQNK